MHAAQWTEFRRLFPAASAWIDAATLEDEHARLSAERRFLESTREKFAPRPMPTQDAQRLEWINRRLTELDAHFAMLDKADIDVDGMRAAGSKVTPNSMPLG